MIVITALPIIREASSNPCLGLETKSGSINVGVPTNDDTPLFTKYTTVRRKVFSYQLLSPSDSRLSWSDVFKKKRKEKAEVVTIDIFTP